MFVIIARNNTIRKIKGRLPYFDETIRLKHLEKLKLTSKIILGDTDNPYKVLDVIKPEIILLGYNQKTFVNRLHEELAQRKLITIINKAKPFHSDIFKSSQIRPSLEDSNNNGFLMINKPPGISSHDVISNLRRVTGIKRIGHAGTLDPLATGVLICGIGCATKLLTWWQQFPKTYKTTLELGKQSDSYDSEGKIQINNGRATKKTELQKILIKFTGELWQMPPAFSAKKIKGKKAYQLARVGQMPKLTKQKINIYSLHLTKFEYPQAQLEITCSSGTYIRSLINDIGKKLRVGAIMTDLVRTSIDSVNLSETTTLDSLTSDNWQKKLISANILLTNINNHLLKSGLD